MTTVRRPRSRSSPARAYRRSPGLVLYWAGSSLACFDCTSGRRLVVSPEVIALLDDLDDWTTVAELERTVSARGLAIDLPRMLRRMTDRHDRL